MHTRLATSNFGMSTAATRAKSWAGGKLRPGVGTVDLYIGQSKSEVEALLGAPDEKVPSGDQYFYVYRSRGIDVDFGASQRVKTLFFFGDNVEHHTRGAQVRLDGVGLGSTRSQVVKTLGRPNLEGGPVRVGRRLKSWICYNSGIEFDLDSQGRVMIMIIFAPHLVTRR